MIQDVTISIVVPVYNVERYLDTCMRSLLAQTYRNYEILLIDDGSTDASAQLCDEYAQNNAHVHTFHKPNGGLSDARNHALPYANGQYITFVDSDDYVDADYLEQMIRALEICPTADLVICSHLDELPSGEPLCRKQYDSRPSLLTPQEALERMCYEREFGTTACAKFISRELASKYPFPLGKLYEDLATVYKFIGDAKQIVFLNRPMYHYIQRSGSIRKSRWTPAVIDVMDAADALLSYIDTTMPTIHAAGVYRYFFSANEYYLRAIFQPNYKELIYPIQCKLRQLWEDLHRSAHLCAKQKAKYRFMTYTPVLYKRIRVLINKIRPR